MTTALIVLLCFACATMWVLIGAVIWSGRNDRGAARRAPQPKTAMQKRGEEMLQRIETQLLTPTSQLAGFDGFEKLSSEAKPKTSLLDHAPDIGGRPSEVTWAPGNCPPGTKADGGKLRWRLVPWRAMRFVVRVLMFGARKYAVDNWQKVENGEERYTEAAMRHVIAHWVDELHDEESGQPHLAHAVCCLLFAMWFRLDDFER